jgi:uncharacterized coiled-coil protein SlyX
MKKIIWFLLISTIGTELSAQTIASFRFSLNPVSSSSLVSGWIAAVGDPSLAVRTATDPATGITISSINTNNWMPNGDVCAEDGIGAYGTSFFFPQAIMACMWLNQGTQAAFNSAVPQLEISGLHTDSVYFIRMTASNLYDDGSDPTSYSVSGLTVQPAQFLNVHDNTANGITFQRVAPDANGKIKVYVNTTATSYYAGISGIQIISGSASIAMPTVHITSPADNDVLAEETNIVINATATETGGTISKVEFFADTVKIGEDATAPYSINWNNPNEGHYLITAKATDGAGTTNSASINIGVESLTSFWSMTGNIGMNADSNFVGNVDSVRLAFRTKNIERMGISPIGNVGIGTINPTAQLHTTGTVRFAGLTGDSTQNRVLVTDTSGKVFYRNVSSLNNRWIYSNGTLYDSSDNIAIGTNNPQGYKLAVNGTAIFTKAKVKTAGTWPDYVFKKDYALPSLSEVENYISCHQHLPGIVSEHDVQLQGIDLGDHASALLKKVEELTLYLIQQDKTLTSKKEQIDDLEKQLASQKGQVDALQKQSADQKSRLDAQQKQIDELRALINAKK